ncbi:MAG TPA: hypothetical protein VGC00_15105 [Thermoanaerobaculia bacterium]|jgi:hypothetical protein
MSDSTNVNATQPLRLVDQRTMERIFAVTDAAGIDREALRVPLAGEGEGRVHRTPGGEWEIVVPASADLAPFIERLARAVGGG